MKKKNLTFYFNIKNVICFTPERKMQLLYVNVIYVGFQLKCIVIAF